MLRLFHTSLFLVALSLGAFSTTTITLYEVVPPQPTETDFDDVSLDPPSITASAIGIGSGGRTTYALEIPVTERVEIDATTTKTVTSAFGIPSTITDVFVEGASDIVRVLSTTTDSDFPLRATMFSQSCDFQGTTAGSCVHMLVVPGESTFITTYTGPVVPVYTLVETASIPSRTQTSGGLATSGIWSIYRLVSCVVVLSIVALVV